MDRRRRGHDAAAMPADGELRPRQARGLCRVTEAAPPGPSAPLAHPPGAASQWLQTATATAAQALISASTYLIILRGPRVHCQTATFPTYLSLLEEPLPLRAHEPTWRAGSSPSIPSISTPSHADFNTISRRLPRVNRATSADPGSPLAGASHYRPVWTSWYLAVVPLEPRHPVSRSHRRHRRPGSLTVSVKTTLTSGDTCVPDGHIYPSSFRLRPRRRQPLSSPSLTLAFQTPRACTSTSPGHEATATPS
ncbi:hypothetical protein Purlil1_6111 [Purpureocillium lilacinum]|uniref:Uncharacterized protein n=1 Tax=Purpureocillium lilacinum TaxID=33203 RepID=A0ABR0BZT7_PURLI|nr:hypothetical protein Purlil1_6111 [Purpureocillium lilacinum]